LRQLLKSPAPKSDRQPHEQFAQPAKAGIELVLLDATGDGHCALPLEKLKLEAAKLLEVPEAIVEQAPSQTLTSGSLLLEEIGGRAADFPAPPQESGGRNRSENQSRWQGCRAFIPKSNSTRRWPGASSGPVRFSRPVDGRR